jgi:hypothetical protein
MSRQQGPRGQGVASKGRNPNRTRSSTICVGLMSGKAHFTKMKFEPQTKPKAMKAA